MEGGSDGCRVALVRRQLTPTDFIISRDGRIAAVYLFFDKLP
jgi:hypothetical protein